MEWNRALLGRFRNGDPDALTEVYRRHVGALTRMLRAAAFRGRGFAILRSSFEIENAVLEVFARAFEPRARMVYDGIRLYEQFLMGIARHYLLEPSRGRELAMGLSPGVDELDQTLAESQDIHRQLEDREVEELLRNFRTNLSAAEAQLYELRFDQGLAQEAAAERMGLTRIQLRRRELALKKKLLAFLKGRGYLKDLSASGWSFVRTKVGT